MEDKVVHCELPKPRTMAHKFHIPLPPRQISSNGKAGGARRSAVTPSTVTPPSLTAQSLPATRYETCKNAQYQATALLSRMASNPTTPRRLTPASSPLSSPLSKPDEPGSYTSLRAGDKNEGDRKDLADHYFSIRVERSLYMFLLCGSFLT